MSVFFNSSDESGKPVVVVELPSNVEGKNENNGNMMPIGFIILKPSTFQRFDA